MSAFRRSDGGVHVQVTDFLLRRGWAFVLLAFLPFAGYASFHASRHGFDRSSLRELHFTDVIWTLTLGLTPLTYVPFLTVRHLHRGRRRRVPARWALTSLHLGLFGVVGLWLLLIPALSIATIVRDSSGSDLAAIAVALVIPVWFLHGFGLHLVGRQASLVMRKTRATWRLPDGPPRFRAGAVRIASLVLFTGYLVLGLLPLGSPFDNSWRETNAQLALGAGQATCLGVWCVIASSAWYEGFVASADPIPQEMVETFA